MEIVRASFYQSIELPVKSKKHNINTLSDDIFPGVKMELNDHLMTISHDDWDVDIQVSTANIRYCASRKDLVMTFAKIEAAQDPNGSKRSIESLKKLEGPNYPKAMEEKTERMGVKIEPGSGVALRMLNDQVLIEKIKAAKKKAVKKK